MKKIVLTGGPCSGKSTILKALIEEFKDQIIIIPEVATLLLEGGFPVPGKHLAWSEKWQAAFQSAVLPVQKNIESAYELAASEKKCKLIICDRGILDGAAYTPGGISEFCKIYNEDYDNSLKRYDAVIHLESLATVSPESYGKIGNESRFEDVNRAQKLEQATREVWSRHPHRIIIDGRRGIDGKIAEVIGIIRFLLSEK